MENSKRIRHSRSKNNENIYLKPRKRRVRKNDKSPLSKLKKRGGQYRGTTKIREPNFRKSKFYMENIQEENEKTERYNESLQQAFLKAIKIKPETRDEKYEELPLMLKTGSTINDWKKRLIRSRGFDIIVDDKIKGIVEIRNINNTLPVINQSPSKSKRSSSKKKIQSSNHYRRVLYNPFKKIHNPFNNLRNPFKNMWWKRDNNKNLQTSQLSPTRPSQLSPTRQPRQLPSQLSPTRPSQLSPTRQSPIRPSQFSSNRQSQLSPTRQLQLHPIIKKQDKIDNIIIEIKKLKKEIKNKREHPEKYETNIEAKKIRISELKKNLQEEYGVNYDLLISSQQKSSSLRFSNNKSIYVKQEELPIHERIFQETQDKLQEWLKPLNIFQKNGGKKKKPKKTLQEKKKPKKKALH